jgi:histidinol-phosphate aminotransferase
MNQVALHPLVRRSLRGLGIPQPGGRYRPSITERMFTNPHAPGYARYPDLRYDDLTQAYASYLRREASAAASACAVEAENVLFTQGAIGAIDLLIRAFCEPREDAIAVMKPTFPLYRHLATASEARVVDVPLSGEGFDDVDADALVAARAKLVFLCNPTSPLGTLLPHRRVVEIAQRCAGLVVVDEAYIDFARAPSAAALVGELANVVVLRTFSKAWGLAGLRAGVAVAETSILNALRILQDPFAFDAAAQEGVRQRLADEGAMRAWVSAICAERERLARALVELRCVRRVHASQANFLCVEIDGTEANLARCLDAGALVADVSWQVPTALRVSIGTREDSDRLITALSAQ